MEHGTHKKAANDPKPGNYTKYYDLLFEVKE
jgi:hypothetical protein